MQCGDVHAIVVSMHGWVVRSDSKSTLVLLMLEMQEGNIGRGSVVLDAAKAQQN